MIGATQTAPNVVLRRCIIETSELARLTSDLAFIAMVLAVGLMGMELRGVLHSKSKPHLIGLGLGSLFLMLCASTVRAVVRIVGEEVTVGPGGVVAASIANEAVKLVAALSTDVLPHNERLAELAEEPSMV